MQQLPLSRDEDGGTVAAREVDRASVAGDALLYASSAVTVTVKAVPAVAVGAVIQNGKRSGSDHDGPAFPVSVLAVVSVAVTVGSLQF